MNTDLNGISGFYYLVTAISNYGVSDDAYTTAFSAGSLTLFANTRVQVIYGNSDTQVAGAVPSIAEKLWGSIDFAYVALGTLGAEKFSIQSYSHPSAIGLENFIHCQDFIFSVSWNNEEMVALANTAFDPVFIKLSDLGTISCTAG
jgi:hypothetical protein